jgi:hypothetical protein
LIHYFLRCWIVKYFGMLKSMSFGRTANTAICVSLVAILLTGCSRPKEPEAGNYVPTYVPPKTLAATSAPAAAETIQPASTIGNISSTTTSVSVTSNGSAEQTTVAPESATTTIAFVPPVTTWPTDPNFQAAIRQRIAVDEEFTRQEYAGLADRSRFDGLGDPRTWIPGAMQELNRLRLEKVIVKPNTMNGIAVYSASYQKPDEILLDLCSFYDDFEISGSSTQDTADDVVIGTAHIERQISIMKLTEGKWLYQGSVVKSQHC